LSEIKVDTAIDEKVVLDYRNILDLLDYLNDANTIQLNDPENKYIDLIAKRRFETLDLVIITGDLNLGQPWDH
jgi:hypothetical protein